jgi:hypothetical protein
VSPDLTVALGDVRPFGVSPELDKDTQGALVRACNELHFIAFVKYGRHAIRLIHTRSSSLRD